MDSPRRLQFRCLFCVVAVIVFNLQTVIAIDWTPDQWREYFSDDVLGVVKKPQSPTDQDAIFALDMALTWEQYKLLTSPVEGRTHHNYSNLWPEEDGVPTMVYYFEETDEQFVNGIMDSIRHWEENTCIKFRTKTDKDVSYVHFFLGQKCYTRVGRMPNESQPVSLSRNCLYVVLIAHEIGHCLGMFHEVNRPDRDQYLDVMMENVHDIMKINFEIFYTPYDDIPYDYTALSHTPTNMMSKRGEMTYIPKDPMYLAVLGSARLESFREFLTANRLYKCIDKWKQDCPSETPACQNLGYVGKGCLCVCPKGTAGDLCQDVISDYYADGMNCTSVITNSGEVITTPNYPKPAPEIRCVHHITAPEGQHIEIKFDDIAMENCKHSTLYFLDYKDGALVYQSLECGKELYPDHTYVSSTNDLYLCYYVAIPNKLDRGFSATVTFKDNGTEEDH